MVLVRSLIFLLLQIAVTLFFGLSSILTFPFHPLTRYRIISGWALSVLWLLRHICGIHMEVRGKEHIPATPCVVMCKHQSAWETIALQKVFPPQVWVLKRELLWIPFFGWGLAMTSPVAIRRSNGHEALRQLLQQGRQRLAQGFCVVVFPEGTRIPYGQRGRYKSGGAALAISSGAPVVPVAHNAGRLWKKNALIKRPGTITMSIGQPIHPAGRKTEDITREVEEWIEAEVSRLP